MKMTVSYEWLCDLVPNLNKQTPAQIGLALTAIGAETEDVSLLNYGEGLLLARVLEITPTKKLSKVKVNTSKGDFTVISNSPRIKVGDCVIFAPIGAKIFGDITVTSREIEGIKTEGLLLALENLGIEPKSADIVILDEKSAQEFFDVYCALDAIYTLDVPGNRADWLSVRELARALAIYFDLDLKEYNFSFETKGESDIPIKIQSDRCYRYSLAKITNIQSLQTPANVQKRLYLLGMRPINYLVDLSNATMLETGQPTHAFDAKKLKGAVVIRQANDGEQFVLLDGTEITLTKDDLIASDDNGILEIVGIMGGLDSGVDETTSEIYLETASFNGVWIRRSAKRLGLKTEASLRFEKNINTNLVPIAHQFICDVIAKDCPQAVITAWEDQYPNPTQAHNITVTPQEINSYLGTDIDDNFIKNIIIKLGCTCDENWNILSTRSDLRIKEDIMEEVARFYGYDKIPSTSYRPSSVQLNPEKSFDEHIRPILRGMGLSEALTIVFRSKDQQEFYSLQNQNAVSILNPLNSEWTELRTHLFDGLLEALRVNMTKAFEKNIALSEIASVFSQSDKDFVEEKHLAFMVSYEENGYPKALNYLNNILSYSKVSAMSTQKIDSSKYPFLHPLNSFEIFIDDEFLGFFGEIHPVLLSNLDLSDKKDFPAPVVCELSFDILKANNSTQTVQKIPDLPPVFRDVTLSVSDDTFGVNIVKDLKQKNPLIKEVEFLSVFQNDDLKSKNLKNISLRLRFESELPINAQEVDDFIKVLLS